MKDSRIEKDLSEKIRRTVTSVRMDRPDCAETAMDGSLGNSMFNLSPVERELLEEGTWNDIIEELMQRTRSGRGDDAFCIKAINDILNDLNTPKRR